MQGIEFYSEPLHTGEAIRVKEKIMKLVKICGLTTEEEAEWVSEAGADFAGMILFFPKSKRNISIDKAKSIKSHLTGVKSVAVVVSPDADQLSQIEEAGFDFVQVHGHISDDLINSVSIPVIKAFNVSDLTDYDRCSANPRVYGYVFDALVPGSGKTFDWTVLENLPRDGKMSLVAGGLTPENVADISRISGIDGADTSSGVENDDGVGKSKEKIFAFVDRVHSIEE